MKKSVKEYMQESSLFEGIMDKEEESLEVIAESLKEELNEKEFSKLASMPKSVAELRAICSKHKGFCDLQKRAAKAGFTVSSGFIQYLKQADSTPKLERVALNIAAPDASASGLHVYFKSDYYGDMTSDKANKLEMDATIYTRMDSKQLQQAKKEIDAAVDFVVWFNSQKIEKLLPVVGEVMP